jgi:DME family drug/metabolite transporter
VTIAAARLVVGAIGLVAISTFKGRWHNLIALWRSPLIWAMGAGVAGYQALFFIGTGLTGVAIGTLASLALGPLMAGLLSWAITRHAPSGQWWRSTSLAIVGLGVLSYGGLTGDTTINVLGVLAAMGAGGAYAIYTVLGARLATSEMPATDVLAASFALGGIALIPFGFSTVSALSSTNGLLLVLWLGVIATTFAYVMFGMGIAALDAGTVATLNLAEPVIAAILGVVIVGESLSTLSIAGSTLIALSLFLLARATMKGAS